MNVENTAGVKNIGYKMLIHSQNDDKREIVVSLV